MEIGLKWLIDEELDAYVEESRQFNAASKAVVGPTTVEELRQARDGQATSLTPSGSNRATPAHRRSRRALSPGADHRSPGNRDPGRVASSGSISQ
jgi:hypothetical protein